MGGLELSPLVLDGSKLKLFHRALAPPKFLGNLADASLLHKPQTNHTGLRVWQSIDQLEQDDVALDLLGHEAFRLFHRARRLLARSLVVVGDRPRRNPEQPGGEWRTSPLERSQARQRLAKHFGGQVLGLMSLSDPPRDIRVHTEEVLLVQLAKTRRIALCLLDQESVVLALRHPCVSSRESNPQRTQESYGRSQCPTLRAATRADSVLYYLPLRRASTSIAASSAITPPRSSAPFTAGRFR